MAETNDLVMQIKQLEADNKSLKARLKFANKEINKCHKTIDRYEKWFKPRLIFLMNVQKT